MKYERLTKRLDNGLLELKDDSVIGIYQAELRLAKLEDKIENGTLVELPLPIGADCWVVFNWHNKKLAGIKKWNFTYTVFELHWGDTAFATKEEAEAKLKEIQK